MILNIFPILFMHKAQVKELLLQLQIHPIYLDAATNHSKSIGRAQTILKILRAV